MSEMVLRHYGVPTKFKTMWKITDFVQTSFPLQYDVTSALKLPSQIRLNKTTYLLVVTLFSGHAVM